MNKNKLLTITNIVVPIILFIILLLTTELNDTLMYLIMLTLFIGFAMPYIVLLITGLCMLNKSHHRVSLALNIMNVILSLLFIFFIILIINKDFIVILIEYIVILIISIINIISLHQYNKINTSKKNDIIEEEKKKNNGAIV